MQMFIWALDVWQCLMITLYLVMLISGDENLPDDVPVSLKQFCFVSSLLWSVLCLELAFK